MLPESAKIGKLGEKAATKWLRERGYMIHDLNWRDGRYEIDIVAEKFGVIHFVEVKTRKAGGWTSPEEAMTRDKCAAMKRAVQSYVVQHNITADSQLDLIAVDMYADSTVEIRYIEQAVEFRW